MLSLPDFQEKQIVLAFLSRGEKLSFKNDNLIIKNDDNRIKHQSSCHRLFALLVVGHMSITSGLIMRARKFNFTILLLSHNLRLYAVLAAKTEGNFLLREKQYNYEGLDIAQHLVRNKIANQLWVLKQIRHKKEKLQLTIEQLKVYCARLPNPDLSLKDVLGIEGVSTRIYFRELFSEYDWASRRPRTKQDKTNTLLDIGYTLLFNLIDAMLNLYGFDTYVGVYHQQFYQRKSLVCDLVEPFRPLIDARIRKAYRLGQIKEEDFWVIRNQYRLFGKNANPYMTWLLELLIDRKRDMFLYVQSYYRAFIQDKEIANYPIFDMKKTNTNH